jgi:hypothetical protein
LKLTLVSESVMLSSRNSEELGMSGADEWKDATFVGSAYEQQFSRSGSWRHRQMSDMACEARMVSGFGHADFVQADLPWQRGPAPDMAKGDA